MVGWVERIALAFVAASTVTLAVLTIRRLLLLREQRKVTEREEAIRPLALSLIAGEDRGGEALALDPSHGRALAAVMTRYSRLLVGQDRERITSLFERRGDVDAAIAGLAARRTWRRAAAAFLLGDMGSKQAVQALIDALVDDPSRDVRAAAARSLGKLDSSAAVSPLVHALVSASVPRAVAGQALLAIGPDAVASLLRLIDDEDPEVRVLCARLAGLLGDAGTGTALLPLLRDTAAPVRAAAAEAMGRLAAESGTAELRKLLDDRIAAVQAAAATALGGIEDADAVPALIALARESDFDAARAAAMAAVRIDPAALGPGAAGGSPLLDEASDLARAGLLARSAA